MKAKEVSVMVVNYPNGELHLNITMKLKGNLLGAGATVLTENIRRAKAKEIRKILEEVEFPNEKVVDHE